VSKDLTISEHRYTPAEIGVLLGISVHTVRRLIKKLNIPTTTIPNPRGGWGIVYVNFDEFIELRDAAAAATCNALSKRLRDILDAARKSKLLTTNSQFVSEETREAVDKLFQAAGVTLQAQEGMNVVTVSGATQEEKRAAIEEIKSRRDQSVVSLLLQSSIINRALGTYSREQLHLWRQEQLALGWEETELDNVISNAQALCEGETSRCMPHRRQSDVADGEYWHIIDFIQLAQREGLQDYFDNWLMFPEYKLYQYSLDNKHTVYTGKYRAVSERQPQNGGEYTILLVHQLLLEEFFGVDIHTTPAGELRIRPTEEYGDNIEDTVVSRNCFQNFKKANGFEGSGDRNPLGLFKF